jgi:flagellar biogenesis protein FliO
MFSNGGVEKLHAIWIVLLVVFQAWCFRPEVFFPRLTEGLKLLKVDEKQLLGERTSGTDSF